MPSLDEYQQVKKIHEKARYYRGRLLNSVACIEQQLACLITEFLCRRSSSIQNFFYENVAMKMSLEKKKELALKIYRSYFPEGMQNFNTFSKLGKIQKIRNKLAHSVVDVSDKALKRPLEEGVGFLQLNDGEPLTDKEFNNLEVEMNMINSDLKDIRRVLATVGGYQQID